MNTGYAKSIDDGLIHRVSGIDSEYTICGDAWDGHKDASDVNDLVQWEFCRPQLITCPKCIMEIKNCRGVRFHNGELRDRSEART